MGSYIPPWTPVNNATHTCLHDKEYIDDSCCSIFCPFIVWKAKILYYKIFVPPEKSLLVVQKLQILNQKLVWDECKDLYLVVSFIKGSEVFNQPSIQNWEGSFFPFFQHPNFWPHSRSLGDSHPHSQPLDAP